MCLAFCVVSLQSLKSLRVSFPKKSLQSLQKKAESGIEAKRAAARAGHLGAHAVAMEEKEEESRDVPQAGPQ